MKRYALRLWALPVVGILLLGLPSPGASAQNESVTGPIAQAAEEKEACTRNLKVIWDAIQAYQFDHKDLPNWLSDLVPDYLTDGNVLICPVCRRTGKTEAPPLADPKLACSYVFDFCPVPVGGIVPGEPRHTRREWKRRQMGLVGSAVPLVRCRHHNPVLNLAFNGTIYESPPDWELMFTNRIRAAELSVRAIFGMGEPEEPVVTSLTSPAKEFVRREIPPLHHWIDLTKFYNTDLTDPWHGEPGDDLASFPIGQRIFCGVEFDARGVVQLNTNPGSDKKYPTEVRGIVLRQRCQHLYFLHSARLLGKVEEGEQIGSYIVHLPNSQVPLEIPIYYGRTVLDWHDDRKKNQLSKELRVAWTGENGAGKRTGRGVRVFLTTWNLAPGVEIESLDFISTGRNAAPFLLGISFD
jgi:hypothetical protein